MEITIFKEKAISFLSCLINPLKTSAIVFLKTMIVLIAVAKCKITVKSKFSFSKKNVLRGLHCDFKSWKMITSVYGKFLLVVVDMRKNSKNYLKHKKMIFDHNKPKIILVPPYYANGHLCLSKFCLFHYKWSYKGKYIDSKKQKT